MIFEVLRNARVAAAGFVVFGVHSLGLTAPPAELIGRRGAEFVAPGWGIAISSQTNHFSRTLGFLDRVRTEFGVTGELPMSRCAIGVGRAQLAGSSQPDSRSASGRGLGELLRERGITARNAATGDVPRVDACGEPARNTLP